MTSSAGTQNKMLQQHLCPKCEDTSSNQNFTAANALASTENLFLRLFAYPFLLRMISKKWKRDHNVRVEIPQSTDQKAQLGGKRKQAQRKDMAAWRPQSWGWKNQGWNLASHQGLGLSCAFIVSVSKHLQVQCTELGQRWQRLQRQGRAWHFENTNSAKSGRKRAVRIRWWRAFLMCYVRLRCSGITPRQVDHQMVSATCAERYRKSQPQLHLDQSAG